MESGQLQIRFDLNLKSVLSYIFIQILKHQLPLDTLLIQINDNLLSNYVSCVNAFLYTTISSPIIYYLFIPEDSIGFAVNEKSFQ